VHMELDVKKFFQVTSPSRPLDLENEEDRKYYIDFSTIRGGQVVEELRDRITFFSPDEPTCQLFTGHIGCGKSTELRRLESELKQEGFHVVYFESSQDLEMGDVDIGDILLAIARRVSESLMALDKQIHLEQPKGLQNLLRGAVRLLQTEIDLSAEASLPGIGKVSASTEGNFSAEVGIPGIGQVTANNEEGVSLVALGIGKISAKTRNSPELRSKLREYLEPRTTNILDAINHELIEPAKVKLQQIGKKGLAVIVDNLDRVWSKPTAWGRSQPEYLFIDRGEQLRQLNCHVLYTMPLSLIFSNEFSRLTSRFGTDPIVLPMIPVMRRDGNELAEGMALMRQMVLARAFPDLSESERLDNLSAIFDRRETLDLLCRMSGGHVREVLRLLNDWIVKERKLPLSIRGLEEVLKQKRNQMTLAIDDSEWELLRQVKQRQQVIGDQGYEVLLRSMFVYEYRDSEGSWFDVNPILATSGKL
jgi:hypothetical protein